jgi:hypothetical protein
MGIKKVLSVVQVLSVWGGGMYWCSHDRRGGGAMNGG